MIGNSTQLYNYVYLLSVPDILRDTKRMMKISMACRDKTIFTNLVNAVLHIVIECIAINYVTAFR